MPGSVSTTAAVSLGTSSTAAVVNWLFQCWQARQFLMPDEGTLMILSGFIAPLIHAIRNKVLASLDSKET